MKKILLLFVGIFFCLSGCSKEEKLTTEEPKSVLLKNIAKTREEKKEKIVAQTVGISLEKTVVKNGVLTFEIWLDNPEGKPLSSVRSFLAFDPKSLSGISIDIPQDSPFSLVAPGEKDFDPLRGLIKIGLAAENPSSQKSVLIATVAMNRLTPQFTTLDFYNPRTDGNTVALEKLADGTLRNVLKMPPVPGLVLLPEEK